MTGTLIVIAVYTLLSLASAGLIIGESRWMLLTRFMFWLEERRQHR